MEIVRATEISALSAARLQGIGNATEILNFSREAIIKSLDRMQIEGWLVNDRFTGRKDTYQLPQTTGKGGPKMDVMIIAIEGYNAVASGKNNVSTFAAITKEKGMLQIPNLSMFKIVVGPEAYGVVDINLPPIVNIKRVARALKTYTENVTVCILEDERHLSLIEDVRKCGARIKLIPEGEISGSLAAIIGEKTDIFLSYGSAPEAVMIASAIKCLGGYFEGKLIYKNKKERDLAFKAGINDPNKKFKVEDLIFSNEIAFAATGITDGEFLEGVRFTSNGAMTHSFVARGETRTYRKMETRHFFDYKPVY